MLEKLLDEVDEWVAIRTISVIHQSMINNPLVQYKAGILSLLLALIVMVALSPVLCTIPSNLKT